MYDDLEPAPGTAVEPRRRYPPASWPTATQLEYTQKLITVALLLLAVPWLTYKLFTNPGAIFAGAGRRHIKGS